MIGFEIFKLAKILFPINRSITGKGVRETLFHISKHLSNLKIMSVPTGTKAFDWIVPQEWFVKQAYIISPNGKKICDFSKNNLHLVGYSIPFRGKMNLDELKEHLHTLPEQPNAIPYITSYYKKRWGFCLTQNEFDSLEDGTYEVFIDSKHFDGELNYGELIIEGKSEKEVFLSTYICHPSMANNELSGPSVLTYLAKWLEENKNLKYSYRIIFIPETIGSITYLSINKKEMQKKIFAGFNISCIGDNRCYSYIPSRNGDTISDCIANHVLKWTDKNYKKYTWLDRGSDERQYCAPGIDLPVASILRTKYGEYPEYHTSLDRLGKVVTEEGLNGGYWALRRSIEAIENNSKYKTTIMCEPQMGQRGLYPTLSTKQSTKRVKLMMDLISLCDGKNSLLQIAEILKVPIWNLYELVDMLKGQNLINIIET